MKRLIEGILLVALASPAALADFTSINNSGANGEPSLKQIIQNYYGGTFSSFGPGNVHMTNGTVTLTRVHDFGAGSGLLDVQGTNFASVTDNVWQDGTVQLTVTAAYAGNDNRLGWFNNVGGDSSYQNLIGDSADTSVTVNLSSNFEWALRTTGSSGTDTYSSRMSDNPFDKDHFVTYRVSGAGPDRWLIAAEDLKWSISDFDYNDWVGEVQVVAVPLPPAAWAGLSLLGLVAARRKFRRS